MKTILHWFPKLLVTRWIGFFARKPVSRWIIPMYVKKYGIVLDDVAEPLAEFSTLLDFFVRRLKPSARRFDNDGFLSPVDGVVINCGRINRAMRLQLKGESYAPLHLLGEGVNEQKFMNGLYVVLYLSPRDYHRIHMPSPGTVQRWTHVPGRLFPVNRLGMAHVNQLYHRNERLISHITSPWGEYAMVKVGAMGVGSIRTVYGGTSPFQHDRKTVTVTVDIPMEKGQELGHFELGSTVILLFQQGTAEALLVSEGDVVQCGDPIAIPGIS